MAFHSTLADIGEALRGCLMRQPDNPGAIDINRIATDSREISKGALFVALQGLSFDGHDFVSQAIASGAVAAIVHREIAGDATALGAPLLQVTDTLKAYQQLGRWWRRQLNPQIIAVTGSVGKTTTKELIAAALAAHGNVLKTQANYNNEIGVPKTLLQLGTEHHFGVVEMGMRAAGEIALLTQIAQPDLAVITNVGTAHIGRLGSEQAIANAKCELLAELSPNGIAILNHDCPRLLETAKRVWEGSTLTYGLAGGMVRGRYLEANAQGAEAMEVEGVCLPLPLPGRHNASNYLAAIAVLKALDLPWQGLIQGLQASPPAGRTRRLTFPNDIVVLDETYNAGVESMTAALHLLASLPGQRRIAVLGTMKELGSYSEEFHRQVGRLVNQLPIHRLLILADPIEAEALEIGAAGTPSQRFSSHADLQSYLLEHLLPGDRILLKASRSVALDRVVDSLEAFLKP